MRLLLVEDDDTLAEAVQAHFMRAGHAVDWFTTTEEAELALRTTTYDVIVLDLGLPDGSGISILRRLRDEGSHTPVIVATARDCIDDRIDGLNAGADDYVIKPYDLNEMLARVAAVSRRAANLISPDFRKGGVSLDLSSHSVTRDGRPVTLTAREWVVMELLIARAGKIVSKTDLENRMYQFGAEIDSNSIEVFISRIRKKLGRDLIVTERGLGYRLTTS